MITVGSRKKGMFVAPPRLVCRWGISSSSQNVKYMGTHVGVVVVFKRGISIELHGARKSSENPTRGSNPKQRRLKQFHTDETGGSSSRINV